MTRLAIVDDHEALREGLETLLLGSELEVVGTAGNVAAALDLVEHVQPDVALVDIRLPDGSGIDLTRQLLAARPHMRVVLYTGEPDADLLSAALDSGAQGYALKAGPMRELVSAIVQVAGGGATSIRVWTASCWPSAHPRASRSCRRASVRSCT